MQGWSGTLDIQDSEDKLTVTNGKAEPIKLKGGESVTLTDIPAGLKYQVEETGELSGWTLIKMERPSGTIAAAQTAESKFTNGYSLSGQASIEVKKELLGRDLTKDEFTFKILDQDGKAVENKDCVAITATNGTDGSVLFPQMTYTEEGEWVYRIVEVIPSEDKIDNTVEYSTEEIVVTVTAKDENGDGKLTTTVTYSPEKKTLTNELKPGALAISKTLVSSNPAHADKEFTFTLTLTDAAGKPLSGSYVLNDTASIEVQDGEAAITLKGGESVVISGLPASTRYSVTETEAAGFTTVSEGESGVIEPTKTAEASFTNTYAAQGEYDFNVTKTLTGREMTEGEFEFVLLDEAGNELETVRNSADGTVSFSQLTFTDMDVGTRVYSIRETDLKAPGMTYDKTVREITLTITDNGNGTLNVTDSLNGEAAEFENSYNDKTSVSVKKVWQDEDNKLSVRPESVTAELYRNGEKQTEATLNEENEWKHTFGDLAAFDEEGITYTYTVKEVPVTGYDSMQSVKDGVRVITNTVQGVLDVSKTIVGGTDESKEFDFTVTLAKADAPLTTELVLAKGENSEPVTPNADGKVSFTLKHGETVRLIGLPIGTRYSVEEAPEAGYTATAENAEGLIQRYEEHKANFINTYEAKGETSFSGVKTLEGRELAEGEFSFMLLDKDGNTIETVQNAADGSYAFTKLEYIHNAEKSELGEYSYTVREVKGDLGGVTYDEKEYTITVTVTDNGDGTLKVVASENVTALDFTNTYEAKGETTFSGVKTLVGRELAEGEFSFTLYDSKGNAIETVKNAADGSFTFDALEYVHNKDHSDLGEHSYTVREVKGDLGGVTYDEKEYAITVTVTDNGDGTLKVAASDNATALNFTNIYEAEGETTFSGSKTLEGRELKAGEFSFTLYDSKGNAIATVKNAADGSFAFTKLEYIRNAEKSDLGEHTYTVKEVKGALKGVTYDDAEYTVKVTVTDNGDGTLKVVASENAAVLDFTNYYDADGELTLRATKTVNGAEPREDEVFTFELCDATGKVLQTAKNEKGKITFQPLKYTEADVGKSFLYTVKEQQEEKPGYTTDATVYTVAVWVADAGDGSLKVTKAISSEGKAVEAMTFDNTYEAKGEWKPTAAKTVNGAEPREDQVYEFTLTDENGSTILAENEKGEIIFDTLTYDLADAGKTYTYTVKEITTPTDLLATDDFIYTVDVTVTDNKDGTLDVKPVITKDEKEVEEITFENKLTTLLSISKTVEGIETEDTFPMTVKLYNANGTEAEGEYAYTGDAEGKLKSGDVIELAHGQSVTISGLLPDMTYTVTEAAAAAYETTVNGNADNSIEGTLAEESNEVNFVNKYKTTMFMVKKSWQGGGGGAIELTLYANGEKIEPQPIYSRDENVYVYTDLPMYSAKDQPIVYSAKEKYVDGFLTIYKNVAPYADETKAIYDGGTIINKAIVKADFSVKKVWSGLAEGETAPEIELVLYCNGEATDIKTPNPDRNGWYKYYDLPGEIDGKPAVYTVKELPIEGYETSYKLADGTSAEYADNGGTITNAKIPQTGDEAPLALWLTLMGASAMMLVLLLKRRKA